MIFQIRDNFETLKSKGFQKRGWIIEKKLWTFEFSRQFILNDMLLRKISQPLKKVQAN